MRPRNLLNLALALLAWPPEPTLKAEQLSPHLGFESGPINAAWIQSGRERVFIYRGATDAWQAGSSSLLLPHGRRDLISGIDQWMRPKALIAPAEDRPWLEHPEDFWESFTKARFHDYAQQTTKVGIIPIAITQWVEGGEKLQWPATQIEVLDTPGFTRGSVSYLCEVDGRRIAFTGDLIYGDGQLLDLYSLQDAIPEAKVGGYHGYAGRLGALIGSLESILQAEPDWLVPARGPIIRDPASSIGKLVKRLQAIYHNYLSTNALHWYFKEDRMRICHEQVLGENTRLELMPYAAHIETPQWIRGFSTSRLILSDQGYAFLLDCGYQSVIDEVSKLVKSGLIEKVEGIFVTHFHDDHSDRVQRAAEIFDCPVYATREYQDVLEHPEAYHLPAMTDHPIKDVVGVVDGDRLKWREYDFTFHFYPGQTFYHGALWVERADHDPIFMVGDSFAPSGLDDYCLMNRNLMRDGTGYLLCMEKIRKAQKNLWLINEHIPYLFRFNPDELDYMETRYRERMRLLSELFPWDDLNYGIDEQWAVFYPYGLKAAAQSVAEVAVKITNHSPRERSFHIKPRTWKGLKIHAAGSNKNALQVTIPAQQTGSITIPLQLPADPGQYLITADIHSEGMDFLDWVEALVTVE